MQRHEDQHPDELDDKNRFFGIQVGGREALEDAAIKSYHLIIESGGTRQQAEDAYFKIFADYAAARKRV